MENQETVRNITFADLLEVLKKSWILVIAVTFLVAALSFTWSYVTYTPEYTGTSNFFVIRDSDKEYSSSDYGIDLKLLYDVEQLMLTYTTLQNVIQGAQSDPAFEGEITPEKLKKSLTFEKSPDESRMFTIHVTASTKENAEILSYWLVEEAKNGVQDCLLDVSQVKERDVGVGTEIPSNSRFTTLSKLLPIVAALVTYLVYLVVYIMDDRIKNTEDVEKYLELNLLGVVPNIDDVGKNKNRYYKNHYKEGNYQNNRQMDGKENGQ